MKQKILKQSVCIALMPLFILSNIHCTSKKDVSTIAKLDVNTQSDLSVQQDKLLFYGGFEKPFNSADSTFAEFENAPWNFVDGGSGRSISLLKRNGKYCGAFIIRKTATTSESRRAELVPADKNDDAIIWKEGTEQVIKASYLFPKYWPSKDAWNIVMQLKQDGTGGPVIEIDANNNRLKVERASYWWGKQYAKQGDTLGELNFIDKPLSDYKDKWVTVAIRVKYSTDPKIGFIEVELNGELQKLNSNGKTRQYCATRTTKDADGNKISTGYYKIGNYRDASIPASVLFVDDVKVGTTFNSVR